MFSNMTKPNTSAQAVLYRGNDISKDVAKTRYYEIGSKGIRLNVAPEDYDLRKPGTNELLTESDVLADQIMKDIQG